MAVVVLGLVAPATAARSPLDQGGLATSTASDLPPHDPIYIFGNGGFNNASGVSYGSGTAGDPYIIEGWNITNNTASGVDIRNTDAHFILRNMDLDSSSWWSIHLSNVSNGSVDDLDAVSTGHAVAILDGSDNITVNNTRNLNGGTAFRVSRAVDVAITNCTAENMAQYGIFVEEAGGVTKNVLLGWNRINKTGDRGIYVLSNPGSTSHVRMVGNTVSNAGAHGINMRDMHNNTIEGNEIYGSAWDGVRLESFAYPSESNDNDFLDNLIHDNSQYGLYIGSGNNEMRRGRVQGNQIWNHSGSASYAGLYLEHTYYVNVSGNDIHNNHFGVYQDRGYFNDHTLNDVHHNDIAGFYVKYNYGQPEDNRFAWNQVRWNGMHGFYVESSAVGGFVWRTEISNNTIRDHTMNGIYLAGANQSKIVDNYITNDTNGIYLTATGTSTDDTLIARNRVWSSSNAGIYANWTPSGFPTPSLRGTRIFGNLVTKADVYGVKLGNVTEATVSGNTISLTHHGIHVDGTDNSTVDNNTVHTSDVGLHLVSKNPRPTAFIVARDNLFRDNMERGAYLEAMAPGAVILNTLGNNSIQANNDGIYVSGGTDNDFIGNRVHNNMAFGAYLSLSTGGSFSLNEVHNNSLYGLYLQQTHQYTIIGNHFADNGEYGAGLGGPSTQNLVFDNNFYRNNPGGLSQGYDDDGSLSNSWNLTYPQGGNFWDNWTVPDDCDGAAQSNCGGNSDGFVDLPYYIHGAGGVFDHYPRTSRFPGVPQFGMPILLVAALVLGGLAALAAQARPRRR